MNYQLQGFLCSFGIHIVLISLVFTIAGTYASMNKPLVIDLSLLDSVKDLSPGDSAGGYSPGVTKEPESNKPCDVKKEEPIATPRRNELDKPRPALKTDNELKVPEIKPVPSVESEGPVPIASSARQADDLAGTQATEQADSLSSNLPGISSPGGEGGGELGRGAAGAARGEGAGNSGEAVRGYLSEHFAYIREIIQKNITYPPRARRMGWQGNVIVSFIIRPNGTVADIKIAESSGFEVLDTNVVKTIKCVAPFPKPPVEAEVRMPITYRLGGT